jgi:antitoxin StbD
MPIQNIKAVKTASLTDLRDPMKVIEAAGDEPVAIMNRNKVIGYFVPEKRTAITAQYATPEQVQELLPKMLEKNKAVLDYLKDK